MYALQRIIVVTIAATGLACALPPGLALSQEAFPAKPIRFVVGYAPGGSADLLARMIARKMSENWKQPVVVDNRPGGGGTLAAVQVAKAASDGQTLLYAGANFVISSALQPTLPYDPFKDFAGITRIGFSTQVLTAAPAVGVRSVKELVALARAQPGKMIYGSAAVGSGPHLTGARFNHMAEIKVITVAFKGAQETLIQIMGGRAHYGVTSLSPALPFIRDGKLLALAVNTPQRSPVFPDVPALAETLPEFKRNETSNGLLAPAGTPGPILNQISKEVARILGLPDIREWLNAIGYVPAPCTPEEYDRILRGQHEILSRLVVDIGLKAK